VNLRGLAFKDIKITNETGDGKPVLVIEGVIVGETRNPVELPRCALAFADEQVRRLCMECVLEQPVLSRASAPISSHGWRRRRRRPQYDVRFFNKRDLAAGRA